MSDNITVKSATKIDSLPTILEVSKGIFIATENGIAKKIPYNTFKNLVKSDIGDVAEFSKTVQLHTTQINSLLTKTASLDNAIANIESDLTAIPTDSSLGRIQIGYQESPSYPQRRAVKVDSDKASSNYAKAYIDLNLTDAGYVTNDVFKLSCDTYVIPTYERVNLSTAINDPLWNDKTVFYYDQHRRIKSIKEELEDHVIEQEANDASFKSIGISAENLSNEIKDVEDNLTEAVATITNTLTNHDTRLTTVEYDVNDLKTHSVTGLKLNSTDRILLNSNITTISDLIYSFISPKEIDFEFSNTIPTKYLYSMYILDLSTHADTESIIEYDTAYLIEGHKFEKNDQIYINANANTVISDLLLSDIVYFNNNGILISNLNYTIQEISTLIKGGVIYKGHISFVSNEKSQPPGREYDLSTIFGIYYNTHGTTAGKILDYDEETGEYTFKKSIPLTTGWLYLVNINDEWHKSGKYVTKDGILVSDKDFIIIHNHNSLENVELTVELSDINSTNIDIIETEDLDYARLSDVYSLELSVGLISSGVKELSLSVNALSTRVDEKVNNLSVLDNISLEIKDTDLFLINELNDGAYYAKNATFSLVKESIFKPMNHTYIGTVNINTVPTNKVIDIRNLFWLEDDKEYLMKITFLNYSPDSVAYDISVNNLNDVYSDYPGDVITQINQDGNWVRKWIPDNELGWCDAYYCSIVSRDNSIFKIDIKNQNVNTYVTLYHFDGTNINEEFFTYNCLTRDSKKYDARKYFAGIYGWDNELHCDKFYCTTKLHGIIKINNILKAGDFSNFIHGCTEVSSIEFVDLMDVDSLDNAFTSCNNLICASFPLLSNASQLNNSFNYGANDISVYVENMKYDVTVNYKLWGLPEHYTIIFKDHITHV